MPTGPALVTEEELAAFLELDVENLGAGATLALELASNAVRDELDQRIDYVEDATEELIGDGVAVLLLPELPVVDVTEVIIPGDVGAADEELTAEAGDFRLERGREGRFAILRRLGGGVWPRRPIEVTYSHGYRLADDYEQLASEVPGTIRLVVMRAAARAVSNPVGVRQETIGRYSATYAGDSASVAVELSETDRRTLGPFYPGSKAGRR